MGYQLVLRRFAGVFGDLQALDTIVATARGGLKGVSGRCLASVLAVAWTEDRGWPADVVSVWTGADQAWDRHGRAAGSEGEGGGVAEARACDGVNGFARENFLRQRGFAGCSESDSVSLSIPDSKIRKKRASVRSVRSANVTFHPAIKISAPKKGAFSKTQKRRSRC